MIRRVESVLVLDDGRYVMRQLSVVRAISLEIDCGCWRKGHDRPQLFDVIICLDRRSGDQAFVRAHGDHAFRAMDMAGPIVVSVDRIFTPEENGNGKQEQ
jgi:hypothetical protein